MQSTVCEGFVSYQMMLLHCRGDLLQALTLLDDEEDVNKVLKYFSYEHFYVIYCKVPPFPFAVESLVAQVPGFRILFLLSENISVEFNSNSISFRSQFHF